MIILNLLVSNIRNLLQYKTEKNFRTFQLLSLAGTTPMQYSSNPFSACIQVFTKPSVVFHTINEKHNWSWIPFILVILFAALPLYMYMNMVDFDWYMDFYIATIMGDVSPAEKENFRSALTPNNLLFGMMASGVFIQVVQNALLAVYLNFATKADDNNLNGFTDWYGFTWWVSLPMVIGFVASTLMLLSNSDSQLPMGSINPLALSYLLNIDMKSTWFVFTNAIRPDIILTIYLIAAGVSQWTNFNTQKVYIIALAPFVLFFTIWFLALI